MGERQARRPFAVRIWSLRNSPFRPYSGVESPGGSPRWMMDCNVLSGDRGLSLMSTSTPPRKHLPLFNAKRVVHPMNSAGGAPDNNVTHKRGYVLEISDTNRKATKSRHRLEESPAEKGSSRCRKLLLAMGNTSTPCELLTQQVAQLHRVCIPILNWSAFR